MIKRYVSLQWKNEISPTADFHPIRPQPFLRLCSGSLSNLYSAKCARSDCRIMGRSAPGEGDAAKRAHQSDDKEAGPSAANLPMPTVDDDSDKEAGPMLPPKPKKRKVLCSSCFKARAGMMQHMND